MKFIKSIDLSGSELKLNVKEKLNIKTVLGGLPTIVLLLMFCLLLIILGKSYFKREKPFLNHSLEIPTYLNYTLNSSSFFFAYRVDNKDGQTIDVPELFYFQPRYIVYRKIKGNGTEKLIDKELTYHKCKRKDFNNIIYDIQTLQNWNCFDWPSEGLTVGGLYDNELIKYIKIKLSHCGKSPKNYLTENNITCSRNETH